MAQVEQFNLSNQAAGWIERKAMPHPLSGFATLQMEDSDSEWAVRIVGGRLSPTQVGTNLRCPAFVGARVHLRAM